MNNKCVVFYESWQMECCGIPFTLGNTVKWLVYGNVGLNTPGYAGKIDYCYEAHSSDWKKLLVLEGKADKIEILYQKYMPSENNPQLLVPVCGEIVKTENAKGFENDINDMKAVGYIVTVSDYTVRQAKQDEVIFK